jgi:hypothetical protein
MRLNNSFYRQQITYRPNRRAEAIPLRAISQERSSSWAELFETDLEDKKRHSLRFCCTVIGSFGDNPSALRRLQYCAPRLLQI